MAETSRSGDEGKRRRLRITIPYRDAAALSSMLSAIGASEAALEQGDPLATVTATFPEETPAYLEDRVATFLHNLDPKGQGALESARGDEPFQPGWRGVYAGASAGGFWIVPPWADEPSGAETIVIDPEGAFGSGLHPATEACLIALAELGAAGRLAGRASQLDVGVGSGILAIAGARRGLARVVGIDLEASARKAAEAAAALNDLSSVIKIVDDRLERIEERFDLVTANLEPHSVYTVVQALQAVTAPGGILVLGGFRHVDADAVAASYDLARTDLFASSDGEWGALVFEA